MLTLLLGGTRSGKSALAEQLALQAAVHGGQSVTYVATAAVDPDDTEHVRRVAQHRARRPRGWATVECLQTGDLTSHLRELPGVVLVDSLGSWLVRHHDFVTDTDAMLSALRARTRTSPTLLVTEEVGLSVHPPTELGRRYIDALGVLNQQVAVIADRVLLVVAGRTLELAPSALLSSPREPGPPAPPLPLPPSPSPPGELD